MGFQIAMSLNYTAPAAVSSLIKPFYGIALETAAKTPALILSLASRGPTAGTRNAAILEFTSQGNYSYYYAYPFSYGEAQFMEVSSSGVVVGLGYGGWDGAGGDPITIYGPVIVHNVIADGQPAQDFYLYQTDWPGLGTSWWQVS